jgi:hypothetical protein
MDRRLFLTGMLSLAGVAAIERVARPGAAHAAVPSKDGILDELDDPAVFEGEDTQPEIEQAYHYPGHRPRRRRRRRRRRVWRRHCRRYWFRGRWRRRCRRRRVWIWFWI